MNNPITLLNDSNFKQAIESAQQPVLVDFWADWCGPCKAIAPALNELAEALAGKLSVAKINVDQSPKTAQRFGVRSIPALYLFKDGQLLAQQTGLVSLAGLKRFVSPALQ